MTSTAVSIPADAFQVPAPLQTAMERVPVLTKPVTFVWRLVEHWGVDECPLKAAAMAFFGLLSIFPIVLAAVAIMAQMLAGNQEVLNSFQTFVRQFFPGAAGKGISDELEKAVQGISGSNTSALGIVAIASLVWSGRAYFETLASVLNSIWPKATPRTFLQQQIVLWSTFVGAGVLWLLSTLTSFGVQTVQSLSERLPDSFLDKLPWVDMLSRLSSWALTVVMFWLIYWFLPNVREGRSKRIVLLFSILAAVAWEVMKVLFARFLGDVSRYDRTYGSVAGVVVTMMWIYFSSTIILLGAEAAAAYQETCEYLEGKNKKDTDKPEEATQRSLAQPGEGKKVIIFVPNEDKTDASH